MAVSKKQIKQALRLGGKPGNVPKFEPSFEGRYYCRGADGPAGHCDDRPMTIQCEYCIWKQPEIERENPYQHYYGWNKPID